MSQLAPPLDRSAWVGAAARLNLDDGAFVRADAAVACTGRVRWELAQRRVQGRPTADRLGADQPFFRVQGRGELFVAAPVGRLVPLRLEDDILYVREDAVVAFEGTVSWEYGHIPRAPLGMLQFRGRGLVTICVRGETGAVKVSPERPVQAAMRNLLGWVGRVVARGGTLGPDDVAGAEGDGTFPGSPSFPDLANHLRRRGCSAFRSGTRTRRRTKSMTAVERPAGNNLRTELTNLPNVVTIGRVLLIPFVLLLIDNYNPLRTFLASLLYIGAAAGDALDGYLARSRNQVSVLGEFLDPLADKLIVTAVLVTMVALGRAPSGWWWC